MMQKQNTKSSQSGFTLVELSIVLVIIGLIVGGVLTGQALIQAAKVRAQLTQLDQMDAALNAFRAKYDCLAGDCNAGSGVPGAVGDADGLIDFSTTWAVDLESALAPNQLGTAGMIAGSYTPAAAFSADQIPTGKLAGQIMFGSDASYNYYLIGSYADNAGAVEASLAFPIEAAKALDTKRDDGLPDTGTVIATTTGAFFAGTAATPGAAACTLAGPPNIYNVAAGTSPCIIRVRSAG